MELMLVDDEGSCVLDDGIRFRLQASGYVFLDPDQYVRTDLHTAALTFDDIYRAKQWCLMDALQTVQAGMAVVMNRDFLADFDIARFYAIGCRVTTVRANRVVRFLRSNRTPRQKEERQVNGRYLRAASGR
ncbi:hypothetical protein [Reinekea blandensis]|uniref:Uncharacterized protein n=1 Tax=Reinekea blandensis MED297 TaxID=314283 RepID=A4BHP9_9GAMM|nr:hypothetical protein [Reinekea blandensis]EAR08304.1 hypothetical protein MED297_09196 [Reinekea sp. MED297] [Reinekea blandensis MED297]